MQTCLFGNLKLSLYKKNQINICLDESSSVKGLITAFVAKQNIKPNVMEIGRAGKAFRSTASNSSVKHNPIKIARKQAMVVFQSP